VLYDHIIPQLYIKTTTNNKEEKKMSLNTSRKILKVSGILCFIAAAVSIVVGIMTMATGGMGAALPEMQTESTVQKGVAALIGVGIATVISGVFSLAEGVVSVRASKDNKYGNAAWIFAMISFLVAIGRAGTELKTNGMTASGILNFLFTLVITGLVYTAALNVKKAYDGEHR